jgi:hypothetical protein
LIAQYIAKGGVKKAARFMQRESIRQQANQSFKEKLSNFSLNLTIGVA